MINDITMDNQRVNMIQIRPIVIGLAGLALGTLVYLVDRPPNTYFVKKFPVDIHLYGIFPKIFGFYGQILPAFTHVFAFSLITAGILGNSRAKALFCCMAWLVIDCLFELGQYYKQTAVALIPDWMTGLPLLGSIKTYFRNGTFDMLDIYAIVGGALIAYGVYLVTTRRSSER